MTAPRGFETYEDLIDHYTKHRAEFREFAAMAPEEYETIAIRFMSAPLTATTLRECRRPNGDTVRYDELTDDFAIMNRDGFIVTYFRPDPDEHGRGSNLNYFREQCGK